jgi:hypothetical protein
MKTAELLVMLSIAAAGSAAAQTEPLPSPYDVNPKCTQRTTDPNDPDCVVPQEGEPRQSYPPPRTKDPQQPPPPPPPQKPPSPPSKSKGFTAPNSNSQLR